MAVRFPKHVKSMAQELIASSNIVEGLGNSIVGLVHPSGNLSESISLSDGKWVESEEEPTVYLPEKLKPVLTRPKRFIVIVGGRGSGKSIGVGDIGLIQINDFGENILCLREFQSSIADSVHGLLKEEVSRLSLKNFDVTDQRIRSSNGGYAKFNGLSRNPESVKSAFGFKWFWVEEAQFLSDKSLKTLTPTARNKPVFGLPSDMKEVSGDEIDLSSVSVVFVANPASSDDPFSQRFIVPFERQLEEHGIYEDDMHLIIKMNWNDNPWYKMSGLEQERQFDKLHLPASTYEWIWEGGFNDDIENALIKPEWFDACVDAHKKLGMKPLGLIKVTHDPSDLGSDPKSICVRKGNVITEIKQRDDLDVNEGSDWAVGIAINENADEYEWDVGGMGIALKRDVNNALAGKSISVHQFNGASAVDMPKHIYEPSGASNIQKEAKNNEVCANLRAQCYLSLRDRVYRTYRAIEHDEMCDPDKLISFSSECESIKVLRGELTKMPIKPSSSSKFELYTKKDMREKFKVRSPNCADAVMMSERKHVKIDASADIEFASIF